MNETFNVKSLFSEDESISHGPCDSMYPNVYLVRLGVSNDLTTAFVSFVDVSNFIFLFFCAIIHTTVPPKGRVVHAANEHQGAR